MEKKNYKLINTGISIIVFLIGFMLDIKPFCFISLTAISYLIFFYRSELVSQTAAKLWCLSIGAATIMVFGDVFPSNNNNPIIVSVLVWAVINAFGLYKAKKIIK